MTREDLIAAAEALEEMAEHLDGLHLLQSRDECLKKARKWPRLNSLVRQIAG